MGFYEFVDLLTFASPLVLIVGIAAGAYRYRSLDSIHRLVAGYLLIALVTDLTTRFYVFPYTNNLVFILLFSLIELMLFAFLYLRLFFRRLKPLLVILTLLGGAFIVWELFVLKYDRIHEFQSYSKVADTFLIVCFAVSFLFDRLENRKALLDYFRLNAVILAFFSVNLLFFLPLNLLINGQSELKFWFWFGNLVATTVFYIFLTREIWINGMNRKR